MKTIWLSGALTMLVSLASIANSSAQTPRVPKLTLAASTEMPSAFGGGTIGLWSGGALLVVQDRFSAAPTFLSFDANNKQLSEFVLAIPDAALIKVFDFARGFDGSIAAAGTAVTNDSRGTPFLALISADGKKQTILRTDPLYAQALTVASDGSVWVASHEGGRANHEGALLRRYDKTGKLLGSFFTWSSLPTGPHLGPPDGLSTLAASKDRIGWYAPLAHVYIELGLDGSVINRFDTSSIETRRHIPSFALCDDGGAFSAIPVFTGGRRTGWQVFALDRQRSLWNPVPTNGNGLDLLLGCEGTRLASTDGRTISWLETNE